jgi:hypothetical protein
VNCNDDDAVVKVCVCVVSVIQTIIRCAMCKERGDADEQLQPDNIIRI